MDVLDLRRQFLNIGVRLSNELMKPYQVVCTALVLQE